MLNYQDPSIQTKEARRHRIEIIRRMYDEYDVPPTLQQFKDGLEMRHIVLSIRTIRRYLLDGAIRYNRRCIPRIERASMPMRTSWGRLLSRSRTVFDHIVFSDEKLFVIDSCNKGSSIVFLRNKQDKRRLRPTGGKKQLRIMVFGVFGRSEGPRSSLSGDVCEVPSGADGTVTGAVYQHVLENFVAPNMAARGPQHILLEDNASSHRACGRIPMPFNRVNHGLYPAHSPDFNAIERMWAVTDTYVRAHLNAGPVARRLNREYVLKLIAYCFRTLCTGAAGEDAIEWAWQNAVYAGTHEGDVRV